MYSLRRRNHLNADGGTWDEPDPSGLPGILPAWRQRSCPPPHDCPRLQAGAGPGPWMLFIQQILNVHLVSARSWAKLWEDSDW